jgi:hypothetical protein
MRKFPLHIEEDNMRKIFAIDAGYELISKKEFVSFGSKEKREYLAKVGISLYQIGRIDLYPPNNFQFSATKKLIFFTTGFVNGDRAQKTVNKITIIFWLFVLSIFLFTSISIWFKLLSIGVVFLALRYLQNKWLGTIVIECALGSQYGLLNMWDSKLLAIHNIALDKTYDAIVADNLFEDIILYALAWDDLMSKKILTRNEYFESILPNKK